MLRTHPLRSLLLAAATLAAALAPAASAVQDPAPEVRACWLTQYTYLGKSEAQLRAIAANIRAGGMNTVYVAVYSGAQTLWPSQAYQAAGGQWTSSGFDWARHLVRIFHEEGLAVGAWFEYGLAVGPASHPVAVANPDWLARDAGGDAVTGENGGFVFLSPGHPEVRETIVAMVSELAQNYDFDDIQLDRIRWGRKSAGREYGYEAVTANQYAAQFGVAPPSNVNQPQWVAFREGLVDSLMEECYDAVKQANAGLVVSSAPTGSYGLTQHMQRWDHWIAGGYLDLVMPQMYTTSLTAFQNEFDTQKALAGQDIDKLAVGYRASDEFDWTTVDAQLDHARAAGVAHGALWVYHQYGSQIAIQDEIDNLPNPGNAWELAAENPFVDEDVVQLFVDDQGTGGAYVEAGTGWIDSAQPDHFAFGSRVVSGAQPATATFELAIPRTGRYDVFVWHTASNNRNPAARYELSHGMGETIRTLDQRTNGGRWQPVDTLLFAEGDALPRVTVSNAGSAAGEYTSADAIKLVYRDVAKSACSAKLNSQGCLPAIEWSGTPSLTGPDDFEVRATNLVNQQFGLFLWGHTPAETPFFGGTLCVAPPLVRTPPASSGGNAGPANCSGSLTYAFTQAEMQARGFVAGTPVVGQFWSRDTQHPDGTGVGLSNSIQFLVLP